MPTLDFKGKPFVYSHHLSVPFRELKIDAGKSLPGDAGPSLDDNLIIHGDNLHALKALLPKYAGKVDVIYIDPPYNTGNEGWAYNDNVNSPLMKEWIGDVVDGDDLERHDKWLCMMWPRLVLLMELLSDNGVIFMSIDENEVSNLNKISAEIFGENNFLAKIVWHSKYTRSNDALNFSANCEFILCFQKTDYGTIAGERKGEKQFAAYTARGDDPRRAKLTPLHAKSGKDQSSFTFPNGVIWQPPVGTFRRFNDASMLRLYNENAIYFGLDGKATPQRKTFLENMKPRMPPASYWSYKDVGGSHDAKNELKEFGLSGDFPDTKPSSLVKFCIDISVEKKDAIILDSFAGSGTTAHAVQALNAADGGNRKFILIETEDYADTITAERVRRVMQGIPNAKDEALKNGLGGTFTYCDLGDPIDMESFFGESKSMPAYDQLASYIAFTATGEALGKAPKKAAKDWFIGEVGGVRLHLIYKPDSDFMKGHNAALDMDTVKTIAAGNKTGKPSYVFAAAKYMGQTELTRDYDMTFCQLPYAIHRIMGDGVDG